MVICGRGREGLLPTGLYPGYLNIVKPIIVRVAYSWGLVSEILW